MREHAGYLRSHRRAKEEKVGSGQWKEGGELDKRSKGREEDWINDAKKARTICGAVFRK